MEKFFIKRINKDEKKCQGVGYEVKDSLETFEKLKTVFIIGVTQQFWFIECLLKIGYLFHIEHFMNRFYMRL